MRLAGLGTAANVIVVGLSGGVKVALCERCCATKLGRMGGGAEGMGGGFTYRTGDPGSSSFHFNRKPLEILIRIHLEDR